MSLTFITTDDARSLLDIAFKAYRDNYPDEEHNASTFLDFVFTHLCRTRGSEIEAELRIVRSFANDGRLTTALAAVGDLREGAR